MRPEDSGLPAHDDRRRVPGLKREEVALLAGVSVDYYARLERGQLGGVSASVLDAIADALRLDEAERQHLRDLADAAGAPERKLRTRTPKAPILRPSVLALLAGMTGIPAYVRNARADILAANDLCLALYDGIIDPERLPFNVARFVFLDGRSHGFFLDWDEVADGTVGRAARGGRTQPARPVAHRPDRRTHRTQPSLRHQMGPAQRPAAPHRDQAPSQLRRRRPRTHRGRPRACRRWVDDHRLHRRARQCCGGEARPARELATVEDHDQSLISPQATRPTRRSQSPTAGPACATSSPLTARPSPMVAPRQVLV